MSIHDNATSLLGRFRALEGFGVKPMPKTSEVLFADDFSDGLSGWNPNMVGGDTPLQPVTRSSYPVPGMRLATGSAYNPASAGCVAYKRLAHLRPGGILSLSIEYAITSETAAAQWSAYAIGFDLQNWDGSFRAQPGLQVVPTATSAKAQLIDNTQTPHDIADIPNPITGSTVTSTQYLFAGENENKGNRNYLRLSYDLGNLLVANGSQNNPATGAPWALADISARYYECNINGYRFDLRATQTTNPPYWGKQTPQAGTVIASFNGGCNAGIQLFQATSATGAAVMTVTGAVMTYHEAGWL